MWHERWNRTSALRGTLVAGMILTGCAPATLAGTWTGEFECEVPAPEDDDQDFEITLTLAGDSTVFEGELEMESEWEGEWTDPDSAEESEGDHGIEVVYEVEVSLTAPEGPQSFEAEGECDDFKWEFEGDDIFEGCEQWGDSDFEFDWDGENTLTTDDPCEGTLTRPG